MSFQKTTIWRQNTQEMGLKKIEMFWSTNIQSVIF